MTSRKKPLKIPDAEILAAQANELARLRAERDAAVAGQAELVAALKPFAAYADNGIGTTVDMVITTGSCFAKRQLTMGDCLRASAALSRADAASGKADLEPKEKLGLKQIEAIEKTFGKIEERLDDLRVIAERLACIQEDVPLADNPKDQRGQKLGAKPRVTPKMLKAIKADLKKRDLSVAAVAKKHGIATSTIYFLIPGGRRKVQTGKK